MAAKERVEALRVEAESHPWDATAARLVALFGEALRRPRGRVLGVEGEGDDPLGVLPRRPRRHAPTEWGAALERMVHAVIDRPTLKQRLSPDGTRRQHAARWSSPGPAPAWAETTDQRQIFFAHWSRR